MVNMRRWWWWLCCGMIWKGKKLGVVTVTWVIEDTKGKKRLVRRILLPFNLSTRPGLDLNLIFTIHNCFWEIKWVSESETDIGRQFVFLSSDDDPFFLLFFTIVLSHWYIMYINFHNLNSFPWFISLYYIIPSWSTWSIHEIVSLLNTHLLNNVNRSLNHNRQTKHSFYSRYCLDSYQSVYFLFDHFTIKTHFHWRYLPMIYWSDWVKNL